jgi:hypothetical protein
LASPFSELTSTENIKAAPNCFAAENLDLLALQQYAEQVKLWPQSGRHILAQFDDQTILVYQAYHPIIGLYAIEHGRFGGSFSLSRMTWIKPNFLWMMYRSGWGTKANQEMTLALRLRRSFFDSILAAAVPSTWDPEIYPCDEEWSKAVASSSVRLQWDPDHTPDGSKADRRAIQLGLRGDMLEQFATRELMEVIDLSALVATQRSRLDSTGLADLSTPTERVYRPANLELCSRLKLSD